MILREFKEMDKENRLDKEVKKEVFPQIRKCAVKFLAVRKGPGYQYDTVATIPQNTKVKVMGYIDNGWAKLYFGDKTYYCRECHLKKSVRSMLKKETMIETNNGHNQEAASILEKGNLVIHEIDGYKENLRSTVIKTKVSRTVTLMHKILEQAESMTGNSMRDIERIINIYFPEAIKFLKIYENAEQQPTEGENMRAVKREIEKFMDTLNGAMEQMLDKIFEKISWDVSSDIYALNIVLEQNGLK